jgi:hypothetical protein
MSATLFLPHLTGSTTQERLGDVLSVGGHVNADAFGDLVSGSGSYDSGRGRAHLILGQSFSTASPPTSLSVTATVTGESSGDYLGWSVDLGDLNDDGYDDVIIGAPEFNSAAPPNGNVYVFFGSSTVPVGAWLTSAADVHIQGAFSTEQCGTAVAALGDVNGDGIGDLGLTCPWYDSGGGILRGRTLVFYGRTNWSDAYDSDDADVTIVGADDDLESGQALVGGFDFDGDGVGDLAVGSPFFQADHGRVVLFFGGDLSSSMSFGDRDAAWRGSVAGDQVGAFLTAGDADGDGFGDLLIGAPASLNSAGRLALVRGASGSPTSGVLWSSADLYVEGSANTEQTGFSGGLIDIDGDGSPDLLACSPGWDGSGGDQGWLQIFYGPLTSYSGMLPSSSADAFVVGAAGGDFFGGAIGVVPDFNGDGANDVLVSSPFSDAGAGNAGRIYFIPGF